MISDDNCAKLRADLRKLYNWCEDWQMLFNHDRCKIMHLGYNNPNNTFMFKYVDEERELWIIIQKDLKSSSQCI